MDNLIINNFRASIFLVFFLIFITSACFASEAQTVDLLVGIPQQNSLSITVSKVVGDSWTKTSNLEFGQLRYDEANNILVADCYYAVDVGINSNSPTWTVTHLVTPFTNGAENLDNNINVIFVKQNKIGETPIDKLSFAASNNKTFNRNQFAAGDWLRIYYGIATGDKATDASGVVPIAPVSSTSGSYNGSIDLTLTP